MCKGRCRNGREWKEPKGEVGHKGEQAVEIVVVQATLVHCGDIVCVYVCVHWHSPLCEQLTWSKHALTAITLALNLPAPSGSRPSFSLPLQMYSLAFLQPKFDEFSMATADPRFSRCTWACVWFWQKRTVLFMVGFFLIGWSCGAMSGFYDPPQFLIFHRTDHFLKVTPQPFSTTVPLSPHSLILAWFGVFVC